MVRKSDQDNSQPKAAAYKKEQILQVAEQRFGVNRVEATAAFFDAPDEMTVEQAEQLVKKFKERTVK
ncbi:hypothetical protein [Brevibacillus sp. 1238]|uniref:hypothetical protein n=1 Tax=Brevibacillus sp. 1238 TaxID=2940565 RepID=UPI0024742B70|nr:hypothetical protein [Brevibacillus sp. 1238]MDH6351926.1 hypothetical protein [Brevibacillus sp. 1238]